MSTSTSTVSSKTNVKPLELVKELRRQGIELFADDNGHSWHKSAVISNDYRSITTRKIPSIVGDAAKNKKLDLNRRPVNTFDVAGTQLVCSADLANPLDIRIASYQSSVENQALVAASIDALKMFDKKIVLGTTTPIGRQFSDGLIEEVKHNYLNRKTVRLNDDSPLLITDVVTYGEGLMAIYDWIIQDDGKINRDAGAASKILVVDIGGGTTDVVSVFSEGKVTIDKECTDTIEGCGIIDIYREVKAPFDRAVSEAFREKKISGYFNEADTAMIDELLKGDGIWESKPFGVSIDISERIKPIREKFVTEMMLQVSKIAKNLGRYDRVVFAGGGTIMLAPELMKVLPSAVYLNEYANAKGLLKVMMHFWLPANFERIMQTR